MKKLMAIVAVALCGAVAAETTGIESQNVVGYNETPISGFKMLTPAFKDVANASYPIDKFIVRGAADGTTTIQVLDEQGQAKSTYYWYNAAGDGYPAGWFDASGVTPADVELRPGEAVFFNANGDGVTVTSAGEVPGRITHGVSGFAMLGNGSPVAIDVDRMTVDGAADGTTTIQVLDEQGQAKSTYYWYNAAGDGYPAGWFDASGVTPAGISLAPGESVLFHAGGDGVSMSVPGALAE